MRLRNLIALTLVLVACEGAVGPMGPEGAPGPGTRTVITVPIGSDGTAAIILPLSSGTFDNQPAISCFISDTQRGPWFVVATDFSTGLSCRIGSAGVSLVVMLSGGPPFWFFRVVAVF